MENDDKLAGLIIRNIAELEGALKYLEEQVTPRLAEAIFEIIESSAGASDWYFSDTSDPGGWFCLKDWLIAGRSKPDANMWLQIQTPGDDPSETWEGSFSRGLATEHTAALLLRYNRVGKRQWAELRAGLPDAMDSIRSAGFVVDGDQIYFSLPLDREQLAKAFEQRDISAALGRIEEMADALSKAIPALNMLHEAQAQLID